jgi:hypothetical protein
MADEIVVYGPNARLMVTYQGSQGDYPDLVSFDASDGDVKQVATEAIRTGYIPGIAADPDANLQDFVVDRYEASPELPPRLILRPKTPFGVDLKGKVCGLLRDLGCTLEEVGIVNITTPDGTVWDLTIPMMVASIPVDDLKRGDMVTALQHLDEPGADVRPGTVGVVFEEKNAYKDGGGPMVKWMNMGTCNVYDGQVSKVSR